MSRLRDGAAVKRVVRAAFSEQDFRMPTCQTNQSSGWPFTYRGLSGNRKARGAPGIDTRGAAEKAAS